MKRIAVLLAGFGLILLAGGRENSHAQNGNSIFLTNVQSTDSSQVQSMQERADRNLKYTKADPVNAGKVAGELLGGSIGAVVGGSVCAFIGFGMGSEGSSDGWLDFDVGGIIGALVGYAVGSNLGSATGVCLVGNTGGESGSFWAALGGSVLGMSGSVLLCRAIDDVSLWPALSLVTGAQAGGATLGFNATRKKRVEEFSHAMFNLEEGRLALALPQVEISQDSSKSGVYKVNLFKASF